MALGTHRGRAIHINAPSLDDPSRPPTGFSATELLLASAGACAAWDVVQILRKRRARVAGLEVILEADQEPDPPWTYRRVALHFQASCDEISVPVMARVIRLSIVRYCSVITTISAVAAIEATVELIASDGTTTGRRRIELAIPAVPPAGFVPPTQDEDE